MRTRFLCILLFLYSHTVISQSEALQLPGLNGNDNTFGNRNTTERQNNLEQVEEDCGNYMIGVVRSSNGFYSGFYSDDQSISRCDNAPFWLELDPNGSFINETSEIFWYKDGKELATHDKVLLDSSNAVFRAIITTGGCTYSSGSIKIKKASEFNAYIHGNPVSPNITICEQAGKRTIFAHYNSILSDTTQIFWYLNDEELVDSRGKIVITVTKQGIYKTKISQDLCEATSDGLQIKIGKEPSYSFSVDGFPENKRELKICKNNEVNYRFNVSVPGGGYSIKDANGSEYRSYESYNLKPGEYYFFGLNGGCSIYDTLKVIEADTFDLELMQEFTHTSSCSGTDTRYFFPLNVGNGYNSLWGTNPSIDKKYFFSTRDNQLVSSGSTEFYTPYDGAYQLHYNQPGRCPGVSRTVNRTTPYKFQAFRFKGEKNVNLCLGDVYNLTLNSTYQNNLVWFRDGSEIAKSGFEQLTVKEPGSYWVTYISPNGCTFYSDTVAIKRVNVPNVNITEECNSGSSGSKLKINVSSREDGLKYRWYEESNYAIRGEDSILVIKDKPGTFFAVVDNGVCPRKTNNISIGISIPNEDWGCSGDSITLKPKGNKENISSIKWVFANGTEMFTNDSLVIKRDKKYNGNLEAYATSLAGCTFRSVIDFRIKDPIIFDIPERIEFENGEELVIPITYPQLTDSTETPQYVTIWNNSESSNHFFPLTDVNSGNNKYILAGKFDQTWEGIHSLSAYNFYGCTNTKEIELDLVDRTLKTPVLWLADNELKYYCQGQNLQLGYKVLGTTDTSIPLAATLYVKDKKDSITGRIENGVVNFGIIPIHFIGNQVYAELRSGNASVSPYRTELLLLKSGNESSFERILIDPQCNETKLTADIAGSSNLKWYKNDELLSDKTDNSIMVSEEDFYYYTYDNPDYYGFGCKTIASSAININGLKGKLKTPTIQLEKYSFCESGYDNLILDVASPVTSIFWYRNDTLISENSITLSTSGREGVYHTVIKKGNCESRSEPFHFKKNKYRKVFIGPAGFHNNQFARESSDELTFSFCKGSAFKLDYQNNLNPNFNKFKNLIWWKGSDKVIETNEVNGKFNMPGVYRLTGQYGFCELLSNKITMIDQDSISTKLVVAPSSKAMADLNFYTINETYFDHFKNIQDHQWYFNETPLSPSNEFIHNYYDNFFDAHIYVTSPGVYYATGTVTTQEGVSCILVSDRVRIDSSNLQEKGLTFENVNLEIIEICGQEPYLLNVEDYKDRALQYQWAYNGEPIDQKTNTLIVTESGRYSVIITTKEGSQNLRNFDILFNSPPTIKLTNSQFYELTPPIEPIGNCGDQPIISLTSRVNNYEGSISLEWYLNDSLLDGYSDNLLSVTKEGRYKLRLQSGNCSVFSDEIDLKFKKIADLGEMNSPRFTCNEEALNLSEIVTDSSTILWMNDGLLLSIEPNQNQLVNKTGQYTAWSEHKGCLAFAGQISITNLLIPDTLFTTNALDFCPGESITLYGEPGAGLSYQFTRNGEPVIGQKNTLHVSESGIYQLFYGKENCNIPSNILQINKAIETTLSSTDNKFCSNSFLEIQADSKANLNYQWYLENEAVPGQNGSTLKASKPGNYYVVISSSECQVFSDTLIVAEHAPSTVTLKGSSIISYGDTAKLEINTVGTASPWEITLSDGQTLTIDTSYYELLVSPLQTTTYTITSIKDVCGEGTASGEAKITVLVLGINDELVKTQAYPNPASEFIFLRTEKEELENLSIYDLAGKLIPLKMHAEQDGYLLDIRSLNAGTYLLKIDQGNQRETFKINKE